MATRSDLELMASEHMGAPSLRKAKTLHDMKSETTRYTCDITGKKCEEMTDSEHSATLSFHFGYGSKLDGARGEFHLSRAAAEEIWMSLSSKYPQLKLEQR